SAQFNDWASSATKAYKTNQEAADTATLVTLTARYGDESIASMLASASSTNQPSRDWKTQS
ncbi:hypothetical protein F442_15328, partial [Phytophthora nicotianae P10297]